MKKFYDLEGNEITKVGVICKMIDTMYNKNDFSKSEKAFEIGLAYLTDRFGDPEVEEGNGYGKISYFESHFDFDDKGNPYYKWNGGKHKNVMLTPAYKANHEEWEKDCDPFVHLVKFYLYFGDKTYIFNISEKFEKPYDYYYGTTLRKEFDYEQ